MFFLDFSLYRSTQELILSREEIVQEARWISLEKLERKRKVEDPNLPLIFYVSCVRRQ